ncbi:MAG: hypothetical protein UR55_C0007G0001, partial [Candidatus Nomurabacteria bacterium GW2011_GWF1_34_20]
SQFFIIFTIKEWLLGLLAFRNERTCEALYKNCAHCNVQISDKFSVSIKRKQINLLTRVHYTRKTGKTKCFRVGPRVRLSNLTGSVHLFHSRVPSYGKGFRFLHASSSRTKLERTILKNLNFLRFFNIVPRTGDYYKYFLRSFLYGKSIQ